MKDCDFLFTPSVLENAPGNVTNEVAAMTFNELPRIPQRLASKQPGFRFRGMECRSSGVSIIVVIITIMMLVINISILLVVVVVVVVVVEGGGTRRRRGSSRSRRSSRRSCCGAGTGPIPHDA